MGSGESLLGGRGCFADGAGYGVGGGPGGLEIEATSDAIDIENLSSEIDAGEVFAF